VDTGFSVDVTTSDGSATANSDYLPLLPPTTVNFLGQAGETHQVTVSSLDDLIVEGTEEFTVSLSNLLGLTNHDLTLGPDGTGTILDNDSATVTIDDVTEIEGGDLVFTLTLDQAVDTGFSVDVATIDGSATSNSDYLPLVPPTTVNFLGNAGETHQVTVSSLDDLIVEGTEEFTVSLSNLIGLTNHDLTVGPDGTGTILDNEPHAVDDTYRVAEDRALTTTAENGVLANDFDIDIPVQTLSAELVNTTFFGKLFFNADGSFAYIPNAGFTGDDTFTYRAFDGLTFSDEATVTITVNDRPVAMDDQVLTAEDWPITFDVNANGDDFIEGVGAPKPFIEVGPQNGTLEIHQDGTFTYTPDLNFFGSDSFTYRANDGELNSLNIATVDLNVFPVNDGPVAVDDFKSTFQDTAVIIDVVENDSDIEGDQLTATLSQGPSNGQVVKIGNGTFTYTPDPGFLGTDIFTYELIDGNGGFDLATVEVTVDPFAAAPVVPATLIAGNVEGNSPNVNGAVQSFQPAGALSPDQGGGTSLDSSSTSGTEGGDDIFFVPQSAFAVQPDASADVPLTVSTAETPSLQQTTPLILDTSISSSTAQTYESLRVESASKTTNSDEEKRTVDETGAWILAQRLEGQMIDLGNVDPTEVSLDQEPDKPKALLSSRPWVQAFVE